MHARSLDSRHHPSRDWLKAWHATICHEIPDGWRLCGENLYAQHSLRYESLVSYFYLFSIWDESNRCLHWDDTCEWAALFGCPVPPVLYRGTWDRQRVQSIAVDTRTAEGCVVRTVEGFAWADFARSVGR